MRYTNESTIFCNTLSLQKISLFNSVNQTKKALKNGYNDKTRKIMLLFVSQLFSYIRNVDETARMIPPYILDTLNKIPDIVIDDAYEKANKVRQEVKENKGCPSQKILNDFLESLDTLLIYS